MPILAEARGVQMWNYLLLVALCCLTVAQDAGRFGFLNFFASSPRLGWQSDHPELYHLRSLHEVLERVRVAFFEYVFVRSCVQSDVARSLGHGVCSSSIFLPSMREVAMTLRSEVDDLE